MWFIPDTAGSVFLLAQEGQPLGGLRDLLLPMIAIGALFYFLIARPERKRKSEMQAMLDNLKKNDRIVTIGGIYGVVVNTSKDSSDVTIRIDDSNNTRLRMLRSAISRVVADGEDSEAKDSQ